MTGTELHNKLKAIEIDGKKIVLKNLAEQLGMKEPAFHKRLKVRDVGIGFLYSICKVLNVPISEFLDTEKEIYLSEPETKYAKREIITELQAELDEAKQIIYDLNLELLRLKMKK